MTNAQLSLVPSPDKPKTKVNTLDSAKSAKLNSWCDANLDMLKNTSITFDTLAGMATASLGFRVTGTNIQTKASKVFDLPPRGAGRKGKPGSRPVKGKIKDLESAVNKLNAARRELEDTLALEIARRAALMAVLLNSLEPVFDVAGADFSELESFLKKSLAS